MARDFVQFFPNQRVDLIDFNDLQGNLRSNYRAGHRDFTVGLDTRILAPWLVTAGGGTSVTVTSGTAFGAEELGPGLFEAGTIFGQEAPANQVVEFVTLPPATYTIYIRWIADPGAQGARVFWDENAETEDITNIDTRRVVSWDARAATASPGPEFLVVADVVWDGVSIVFGDVTHLQHMYFEGDQDGGFAHEWGDGANDRDADRGSFGVGDLHTWVQAVRRQITELAGDGQKWYEDWAYIKHTEFRVDAITDFWTATDFRAGTTAVSAIDIQGATVSVLVTGASSFGSLLGLASLDGGSGTSITTLSGNIGFSGPGDILLTTGSQVILNGGVENLATTPFRAASGAPVLCEDTLTVIGGQTSGDNVNFTGTVENLVSIPAGAFSVDPGDVGQAIMLDAASPSRLQASATGDVVRARTALDTHMPNGAVLNNVVVQLASFTASAILTAIVLAVDDSGTRTVIAGPTTAVAGSGDKTITFAGIAETVAHQTKTIYLKIILDNNSGGVDGARLYRAKASWQQDELYPDPEIAA